MHLAGCACRVSLCDYYDLCGPPTHLLAVSYFSVKIFFMKDLHGHVEEDGEQELVVDSHGYEPALVELARSLPDHDAEPDAPQEKEKLN